MKLERRFLHLPLAAAVSAAALLCTLPGDLLAQHQHHQMSMPETGLRAELIRDIEQMEAKYLALADAMAGEFGWRPADGVRSVSEVFMHVAYGNFMLPTMAGIDAPSSLPGGGESAGMEAITDPGVVSETLAHAFRHARHAVARTPEAELDTMTMLFGREVTKRVVLNLLVTHMHEHLGQAVAYARMVGVTPPWSASAGG